ncbi:hypothetical protein NPIL_685811 [Nephila pilipes]|uniref:Uncharacterized protein n=1 Tax=Nephila pilipes TaxID=299642 RepID=A0A8X6IGX0_NEPPI|nr:hypothetical protein NPIL_685811 [Nephila pilipes]
MLLERIRLFHITKLSYLILRDKLRPSRDTPRVSVGMAESWRSLQAPRPTRTAEITIRVGRQDALRCLKRPLGQSLGTRCNRFLLFIKERRDGNLFFNAGSNCGVTADI